MKEITQLAPLGIGLVVFGVAVTFMLQRGMAVGVWLLAAFLVAHGLVHIMFAAPPPVTSDSPGANFAFDASRSWLVSTRFVDVGVVRWLVVVLVTATVIGYSLAGAATAGLFVPADWWLPLVLGATAASGLLMVIGLSPALTLGIAIDLVLVWMVVTRAWAPSPAG